MKIKIPKLVEHTVSTLRIIAPVNYEDEEIPFDFFGRVGDTWTCDINLETGTINDWPASLDRCRIYLTVHDEGRYQLLHDDCVVWEWPKGCYVPNDIIPGSFGDTIDMVVEHGKILNFQSGIAEEINRHIQKNTNHETTNY